MSDYGEVNFVELRDQVAAYLTANMTAGHLVTTLFSVAQAAQNEVEKAIVLVAYGNFVRMSGKGANFNCYDYDLNAIQIRLSAPLVQQTDDLIDLLLNSGAEVVNLLSNNALMGSPPFGNIRIGDVKVKSGTFGTMPAKGGTAFYIVFGPETMTS